jgi:hypothetical protein
MTRINKFSYVIPEKEEATNEKEVHAEVASEDVLLQDVSRDKVVCYLHIPIYKGLKFLRFYR